MLDEKSGDQTLYKWPSMPIQISHKPHGCYLDNSVKPKMLTSCEKLRGSQKAAVG